MKAGGWIGLHEDITERRNAEIKHAALEQQDARRAALSCPECPRSPRPIPAFAPRVGSAWSRRRTLRQMYAPGSARCLPILSPRPRVRRSLTQWDCELSVRLLPRWRYCSVRSGSGDQERPYRPAITRPCSQRHHVRVHTAAAMRVNSPMAKTSVRANSAGVIAIEMIVIVSVSSGKWILLDEPRLPIRPAPAAALHRDLPPQRRALVGGPAREGILTSRSRYL
jgi:hypothetical protein